MHFIGALLQVAGLLSIALLYLGGSEAATIEHTDVDVLPQDSAGNVSTRSLLLTHHDDVEWSGVDVDEELIGNDVKEEGGAVLNKLKGQSGGGVSGKEMAMRHLMKRRENPRKIDGGGDAQHRRKKRQQADRNNNSDVG